MPATPELVSMAQSFSGLPLGDLIGTPLIETCRANNRMALTQTKYILDTGFEKIVANDGSISYKPIEINLTLERPIITTDTDDSTPPVTTTEVTSAVTDITLPLISAIPVALIGVDFVRVSFDMEVKSSFSRETTQREEEELTTAASLEAKFGFGGFSAKIKGSVSYHSEKSFEEKEKFSKSNSARYNIEVTARQQPLPQGLAVLLEAFAKNVGPYETGTA
jgi:hypothetical protein